MSTPQPALNPLDEVTAREDAMVLDKTLRNAPSTITKADRVALIASLRRDRARFIQVEARKAAKKAGEVEEPEADDKAE